MLPKILRNSLIFNFLDASISVGLLFAHNWFYRSTFGPTLHGEFASIFSLLYFLLSISDLGLHNSMPKFTEFYFSSKKGLSVFSWQLITQIIISVACSFLCLKFFYKDINPNLLLMFLSLIAFESVRKYLKSILQSTQHTGISCTIEILSISNFILLFWLGFFWQWPSRFGCDLLFFSLCLRFLLCAFEVPIMAFIIYYKIWKKRSQVVAHISLTEILKTRAYIYANYAFSAVFSSNFLIPFSYKSFGPDAASFTKLFSSFAQWLTILSHKAFGLSFASFVSGNKISQPETDSLFLKILEKFFLISISIFALLLISSWNTTYFFSAYFFLSLQIIGIMFVESFLQLYKLLYLIRPVRRSLSGVGPVLRSFSVVGSSLFDFFIINSLSFLIIFLIIALGFITMQDSLIFILLCRLIALSAISYFSITPGLPFLRSINIFAVLSFFVLIFSLLNIKA